MTRKEYNRNYQRGYSKTRYYRLKGELIAKMGGKCALCPSQERLEFDHIDPTTKLHNITEILKHPAKLEIELPKCQLLCHECHKRKSLKDTGRRPALGQHGTVTDYRNCRCDACRDAHNTYCREWKRRRASNLRAKNQAKNR